MARLTSTFDADYIVNHMQHEQLIECLRALDSALDDLVCHSEVFANLGPAQTIVRCGRELSRALPQHFEHEERSVLDPVATLGPEMAAFAREMKRQHRNLSTELDGLQNVLEELGHSSDLEAAIAAIKECGHQFTRQLAAHMGAEERKLSSLDS